MAKSAIAICAAAGALLWVAPAFSQGDKPEGQGRAVVTVLAKQQAEVQPYVSAQDLSLKVNGKASNATGWTPLRGPNGDLELVILIDGSARNLNGRQFDEIAAFIDGLPPRAKAAIGYMQFGRAELAGPLSTDRAATVRELHVSAGSRGASASPYLCISDLARRWPSSGPWVRRVAIAVTDGVDPDSMRYDPDDPRVSAAIDDSARAGVIVYSIFWTSQSGAGSPSVAGIGTQSNDGAVSTGGFGAMGEHGSMGGARNSGLTVNQGGQNLMFELAQGTGGRSYAEGIHNPLSFRPYLDDIARRLENQYALTFTAPIGRKPSVENMKLKAGGLGIEVTAPEKVFVDRPPEPAKEPAK
jgi:hypothetical protein